MVTLPTVTASPAKAGVHFANTQADEWTPAFAGETKNKDQRKV